MTADAERRANSHGDGGHQIAVWDPLVRVGHWLLVLLFFVAYFTEDDLLTVHSWAGYGVSAYIVVRVVWGLIGPQHARFSDFAYGPVKAALYFKELILFQAKRYIGHSPAGGLMVFALLLSLSATTVSGMALLAVEENAGPFAPWLGRHVALEETLPVLSSLVTSAHASEDDDERTGAERGEALEEIHEFFSNLTLVLVVLHIAGVALASLVHKENLARAMVTGRKRRE